MFALRSLDHRRQMHKVQGGLCVLVVESSFVNVLKCLPLPLAVNAGDSHRRACTKWKKGKAVRTKLTIFVRSKNRNISLS